VVVVRLGEELPDREHPCDVHGLNAAAELYLLSEEGGVYKIVQR
jgi:hypothetical protein